MRAGAGPGRMVHGLTLGVTMCLLLGAYGGQSGPFPLWKGRASLFCPPGNHAVGLEYDDHSHEKCVMCEPGKYSNGSDAWSLEACHDCEPGTFTGDLGSAACVPCEEGTFTPGAGATACEPMWV